MTGRGVSRRTVLRGGLGLAAAGLVGGCATDGYQGPPRTVVIAAGERGGFYLEFAQILADAVTAAEPALHCTAMATAGSQSNLDLLAAGHVDLALALADTATAAAGGSPPLDLRALGRVYENYTQLVVLADSAVRAVPDLAGRTVSLGAAGSGAALSGDRILAAAGMTAPHAARITHLPLADAVSALEHRAIDALLWSGGVPTPALAALDARSGIRLIPLDSVVPSLRATYGTVYEQVSIPADAYRQGREVPTVGIANLLVAMPNLPDAVASAVVDVLVRDASRLVPPQALGAQFLDVRTLIVTAGLPLHPGAAAAYRNLHG